MKAPHLLFLVIILSVHSSRASRLLPATQPGRDNERVGGFSQIGHAGNMDKEDTWDLMGLEECEDEDEECLKRRAISEAHLDYIYTQRYKKP
ncbi:putative phytosulfokines 6 [Typha angustifolia]|uniref:putative phytosulfokines 6 n=1 Tax=Typha angustifolia TaxID=59011 RepID=UPI003C2B9F53